MAKDASEILGAAQLAGVRVSPRGAARGQMSAMDPTNAGAAKLIFNGERAPEATTPKFGHVALLAVTDAEVALVKLKTGLVGQKLDGLVTRVPRDSVAAIELGDGVVPGLMISFTNGELWDLEVPRPGRKNAETVVGLLSR